MGLRNMPDEIAHTCVTSPPYFGLRDYGHKCQIGLEQTPDDYVEKLVKVFREVKRVLRKDGTLWLNLGDSYYNYRPGKGQGLIKQTVSNTNQDLPNICARRGNKLKGLKEKDLIGIPWMVAFALRSDGWYLRQDIIWSKPNPMPESVRDRCTRSHEHIFMLAKSQNYFYDADAIKEHSVSNHCSGNGFHRPEQISKSNPDGTVRANKNEWEDVGGKRNKRDVWAINTKPFKEAHFAVFPEALVAPCILAGSPADGLVLDPFTGSGTTGVVALRHGRRFQGVELNPEYIEICSRRIAREDQQIKLSI